MDWSNIDWRDVSTVYLHDGEFSVVVGTFAVKKAGDGWAASWKHESDKGVRILMECSMDAVANVGRVPKQAQGRACA